MSCIAGITTRPEERKREWQRIYPRSYNWRTYGPFLTRAQAQEWEDRQSCEHHAGGKDPDNPWAQWWGYRFDY